MRRVRCRSSYPQTRHFSGQGGKHLLRTAAFMTVSQSASDGDAPSAQLISVLVSHTGTVRLSARIRIRIIQHIHSMVA